MFATLETACEYLRARLRNRPHQPVEAEELGKALEIPTSQAEMIIVDLREAGRVECPPLRRRGDGTGGGYFPAVTRVL
ncbi:hypothetical protein [Alloactinosynnema sp. L-07]|nr:hypothetical protein [Alloactinosynnema sp. L-07]